MRAYSIVITNPTTGELIRPPSLAALKLPATWTSWSSGQNYPSAQNIEIDIPVSTEALPVQGGFIRIWGISVAEISQAQNLNGMNIAIYAGMQKGLPLANPKQYGLIAQGQIQQAFGNWINEDMTLDLILQAPTGFNDSPINLSFNWQAGQQLSDALKATLSTAFPNYTLNISINQNLVQTHTEPGYYGKVSDLAQYIRNRSIAIIGKDYPGVDIAISGKTIDVFDNTTQKNPKQIAFQDMIGQPTWINGTSVQVKFVMRSDLHIGDVIKFPQAVTTTTAQSNAALATNQKVTFQGLFQIGGPDGLIRHVGNFRQEDAGSWNTIVNAYALNPAFKQIAA